MTKINLDSPKVTIERSEIIKDKPFLRKVYLYFYKMIKKELRGLPNGRVVELGSGGGFIKDVITTATTSDIMSLPNCDLKLSAENLPFKKNSISAFVMLNVFHHIKNPEKALKEFQRCLKRGGKVIMIEPNNSHWSRFIFQNFHHEIFNPNSTWKSDQKGALSGANGALPWIVFSRDKEKFLKSFTKLKILKYKPHTIALYLLSGGFTLPSLFPSSLFPVAIKIEDLLYSLVKQEGMFCTIVLTKTT